MVMGLRFYSLLIFFLFNGSLKPEFDCHGIFVLYWVDRVSVETYSFYQLLQMFQYL